MNGKGKLRVMQLGGSAGMFGAERWILALGKHLPREEVEVTVGVIQDVRDRQAPLSIHAERAGLQTFVVEAFGKLSLPAIPRLRQYIRAHRIDVLHTHGYKTDILGALAARGTGCLLVSTPHGWSVDAGFKLQMYEALDRASFAAFDAVVPLSDSLARGLAGLPWLGRRLRLIRNGVDLAEIAESSVVDPELAVMRSQGTRIYGYIGQLIERKRLDTLIRAFALGAGDARRLYLVGDGPQRAQLEALASSLGLADRVVFTGFQEDRLRFLRGFDIFVLPSALEGIPRCLMEAMAASIPVIASNIDGNSALVKHGETGLLFELGDHRALAACLGELEQNPDLGRRLALAGRDLVTRRFSASRMAGEYLDLYRELLACATYS